MSSYTLRKSAAILLIICAALICYANSFNTPFLWDDEVLILRNHYIKSLRFLGTIFASTHFQGGGEGGNFYRPIQILSYSFNYFLWQLNPFGYHLSNLALHCLVGVAVYFLITKLGADNLVGFLSALFFVVHPVHTEAVTYIAGRADILAVLFLLLAFITFLKVSVLSGAKRSLYWAGASLLYIFALLSKESALIFLFLTFFYGLCFLPKKQIKPWIPIYATFLLISAVYVFIRVALLDFPQTRSLSLIAQAPMLARFLTIPKIWLGYLGLLILPLHLHMERHFLAEGVGDPYLWLGLISLLLTVWLLKSAYQRSRLTFFYSGWFVLSLIPVLNIVPLNATMAEHWLYLPSVGFWALAAVAGVRLYRQTAKSKEALLILACSFFLFYCGRTIMRNYQWQDSLRLYTHDLEYSPQSFLLHNNLGVELFRKGEIDKAGKEFQRAVELSPRYATSHNNLGVVLENQGRLNEAIAEYEKAIELNNYILAFANLARAYLKTGQPQQARAVLEKGQRLYPHYKFTDIYLEKLIKR